MRCPFCHKLFSLGADYAVHVESCTADELPYHSQLEATPDPTMVPLFEDV